MDGTTSGLDLKGRVAMVTGASRGIGRAIALALGRSGASLIAVARDPSRLADVCEAVTAAGGDALPVACDLSCADGALRAFAALDDRFGGRLDILVNNAGIGRFGAIADVAVEDWDQVMAVNLRSTFVCCREALRRMAPAGRGYIINMASVVGIKGYPEQGAYTASKHGVVGLTKTLAVEAQRHGIRVSVICPGGVDTELVGCARPDLDRRELLQPEDIAGTVCYLLSLSDRAAVDCVSIRRVGAAPF